jgi:hypothetical protein
MTKADVRAVSRHWQLSTWDKAATLCLAGRARYGVTITPARLARVERADAAVRAWLARAGAPTWDLRVRDLGDIGRAELDQRLVGRPEIDHALAEIVRAEGFDRGPTGGVPLRCPQPRADTVTTAKQSLTDPCQESLQHPTPAPGGPRCRRSGA